MKDTLAEHFSDTTRTNAAYRATESARPDAVFEDRLADGLAGERGRKLAKLAPMLARNGWPIVARTKAIDELILTSIADGCDRILNLGAGFDTRPYRLDLPADFHWVDVDLPAMVDQAERRLRKEQPRCRVFRSAVDITDAAARAAFLDDAVRGASKVAVVTEGLLIYLEESQVRDLHRDLTRPEIGWWITDLSSPGIVSAMRKRDVRDRGAPPLQFGPANGVAVFEQDGWQAVDVESEFEVAARLNRLPRLMRMFARAHQPDPRDVEHAQWSGITRVQHVHADN